jgi:hypothetical protein
MADDFLQRLAAEDPWLAKALEQPVRDPLDEWRERHQRRDSEEEERVRKICIPLIARAAQMVVNDLRSEFKAADEVVEEHLRRVMRSLTRRARLRRWSKKDIQRYVDSVGKPKDE